MVLSKMKISLTTIIIRTKIKTTIGPVKNTSMSAGKSRLKLIITKAINNIMRIVAKTYYL